MALEPLIVFRTIFIVIIIIKSLLALAFNVKLAHQAMRHFLIVIFFFIFLRLIIIEDCPRGRSSLLALIVLSDRREESGLESRLRVAILNNDRGYLLRLLVSRALRTFGV